MGPLLRFKVYLWPHNDDVVPAHMSDIAARLFSLGASEFGGSTGWKPLHGDDAADVAGEVKQLITGSPELKC